MRDITVFEDAKIDEFEHEICCAEDPLTTDAERIQSRLDANIPQ